MSGTRKARKLARRIAGGLIALSALALAPQLAFARDLKVVTYNVWGLPSPLLRHPERFERIPAAVNSLDADVVLIQEAFTGKARALESLPRFPYVVRGPGPKFLHFSSGLMILSRYPIVASATTEYKECGGFDCFANKGAVYARILMPGQGVVSVFNTHMNANHFGEARRAQAAQLVKFVRAHSDGLPTIVGGDFNGNARQLIEGAPGAPPLRDAHVDYVWSHHVADKREIEGYTADPTRNHYLGSSETQRRLDQIYVLDGPTVGWKVLGGNLVLDGTHGSVLSDHFGVRAVMALSDLQRARRPEIRLVARIRE